MPDTLSVSRRRLVCGGYCAYGPLRQIMTIGGLAALFVPLFYKALITTLSTPVATTLRPPRFFLFPDDVHVLPLWCFLAVGLMLAILVKLQRRMCSAQNGWSIPLEVVVGIPVFTAITRHMFKSATDPMGEVSFGSLQWSLFIGATAFLIWYGLFQLGLKAATKLLWAETTQAVIRQYVRCIGIPSERIYLIQVDEHNLTARIRGSLSDLEVKRLRMGLLMAIDQVMDLEVFSTRASADAAASDLIEFQELAKSRREAALARLERQQVTSGVKEGLKLPWQQRFLQHRYAKPIIVFIGIIWALVIGLVLWTLGLLRPISSEDIAGFFGASGRTQRRELLLTD
ncbi:MAG: hypothetical protein ACOX44_14930 [Limnochordia bacterium]|jgi:hypothetical protein